MASRSRASNLVDFGTGVRLARAGLVAAVATIPVRRWPEPQLELGVVYLNAPSSIAIAHVMLGDVALASLSADLGLKRGELERLAATYRVAGRKTLSGESDLNGWAGRGADP